MIRKNLLILVAALLLFGAVQTSDAALQAVDPGPYNAAYGYFPIWYADATATLPPVVGTNPGVIEYCLSTAVGPNGPMCILLANPGIFDPALPIVFPVNFPDEGFYMVADANATGAPGARIVYRAAVEAAFAAGAVINGDQITFSRIRSRVDLPAGSAGGNYSVIHPYGTDVFAVPAGGGNRAINSTADVGVAPGVFTGALAGAIGPWLTASTGLIPISTPTGTQTFIGDPNILQAVVGGPNGNIVAVTSPLGATLLTTNQFNLAGKLYNGTLPTAVTVDRSTYSRTALGSQVDVFVTSAPTATVTLVSSLTGTVPTPMISSGITGTGKFYAQILNPAVLPTHVIVTAADPTALVPTSPTPLASQVVDVVKITKAVYALDAKSLVIEAASSDQLPIPTLTALGWGVLSVPTPSVGVMQIVVPNVLEPPARVRVVSSAGGSDTEPVIVVPTNPLPLPLIGVAAVTPASLSFAAQLINTTSAVQTVSVSNTGTAPLLITGIVRSGANPGQFLQNNTCPIGGAGLASGATCTINATFTPTTAGAKNASIAINVAAPAVSKTVTLTGTGFVPVVIAPIAVVTPTALSFANQTINGTSAVQTVTVRNTGNAPLIITGVIKGGANAGQFTVNNGCQIGGAGLAPGTFCTIKVKFKPTVVGVRNASVAINVAAPAASQTVTLTGIAIP